MTSKMDRRTFLGGAAAFGARMLAAKQPFEDTTSWDPFVPNEVGCLPRIPNGG